MREAGYAPMTVWRVLPVGARQKQNHTGGKGYQNVNLSGESKFAILSLYPLSLSLYLFCIIGIALVIVITIMVCIHRKVSNNASVFIGKKEGALAVRRARFSYYNAG